MMAQKIQIYLSTSELLNWRLMLWLVFSSRLKFKIFYPIDWQGKITKTNSEIVIVHTDQPGLQFRYCQKKSGNIWKESGFAEGNENLGERHLVSQEGMGIWVKDIRFCRRNGKLVRMVSNDRKN
jgi:hypothetical protein